MVTCNAFARISAIYLTERIRDSWKFFREILNPSAADSSAPMGHLRTLWSNFLVYCSGGLTVGNLKARNCRRSQTAAWSLDILFELFVNCNSIDVFNFSRFPQVCRGTERGVRIPLLWVLPNESSDANFATVGAVYDRPYFVESRKNGRS